MKEDALPIPVWSGSFTVFGVEIKCHVLDSGERIIEEESMAALFVAAADGSGSDAGGEFLELMTFCKEGSTDS